MIIEVSKNVAANLKKEFNMLTVQGSKVDCGTLTAENIEQFIELSNFLQKGNKGKAFKYKIIETDGKELVEIFAYNVDVSEEHTYFAGLLEAPAIASITDAEGDYRKLFYSAINDIKLKCDNKTENMIYYTSTAENTYLNVSKNILNKYPQSKLKQLMVTDIISIFKRFDECNIQFGTLPALLIEDPLLYLYLVQGYGKCLVDLLDLDYSIPDISEFYNYSEKIAFEVNGQLMLYIPGSGLVPVSNLNSFDAYDVEGSISEVF